jgi:hypothetical protein
VRPAEVTEATPLPCHTNKKEQRKRTLKSFTVVPLSSSSEEEMDDLEESPSRSAIEETFPNRFDSVEPPKKRRKRSRSPGYGDVNDSDSDWDPRQSAAASSPVVSSAAKRRRRGKKLGRQPRKVPPSLDEVKGRGVRRKKCRISSPEAPPAAETNAAPPGLIGCNFADCGELFESLGLLARHLEHVHREASILRCPLCGKYFTQSQPFDLHLAENHTAGREEEGEGRGGGTTSALPVMKPNHVIGKRFILTRGMSLRSIGEVTGVMSLVMFYYVSLGNPLKVSLDPDISINPDTEDRYSVGYINRISVTVLLFSASVRSL